MRPIAVDNGRAPGETIPHPLPQRPGGDELLARLRTAQGHLKAVVNMAARGAEPEEILPQLWSVEAALSAAARQTILAQLRASAEQMTRSSSMTERSEEAGRFARLVSLASQHTPRMGVNE